MTDIHRLICSAGLWLLLVAASPAQIVTNNDAVWVTNASLYSAYTVLNATTNNASFIVEGASTASVASLRFLGEGQTDQTGTVTVSVTGINATLRIDGATGYVY